MAESLSVNTGGTAPISTSASRSSGSPHDRAFRLLLWCAVAFGLLLRGAEYLENRSLWLDESFLSLNIIQKPIGELHKPLDYKQGAPLGFLIAQKLCVLAFGGSEYALRLFPLVCSMAALIFFARLALGAFPPFHALIAVTLFAVADPLIYYAAEAKQYGCDAAVNAILLLAAMRAIRYEFDTPRAAQLGAAGAVAVFFSHPSVFVLAGVGLTLSVDCLLKKRWRHAKTLAAVFGCWAIGFALCYVINLRYLSKDPFFEEFWRQDFLPSLLDVRWIQRFGVYRFLNFLALSPRNLPIYILLALGFVRMVRANPMLLSFALTPIAFASVASVLHKYPLFDRFLVFLIPPALLVLGAGVWSVAALLMRLNARLGYVFAAACLAYPVAHGAATLWTARNVQDLKPVLAYIQTHKRPDDVIYVSQLAAYPYKYYAARYGLNPDIDLPQTYVDPNLGQRYADGLPRRFDRAGYNPIILGYCSYFTTTSPGDLDKDLSALRGIPRAWVLITHGGGEGRANIQFLITSYLDAIGTRIDSYERPGLWGGSAAYLYDLTSKAPASSFP
ncbi:MAG: hypothetical protein HZB26_11315 [Candidatus Hydrogenedentes bacterium]|nr:hypothetical protein [Candidatus Hydrogenedentota bacterium]